MHWSKQKVTLITMEKFCRDLRQHPTTKNQLWKNEGDTANKTRLKAIS